LYVQLFITKNETKNACNIATTSTTSTILVVVVILLLLLFDANIFYNNHIKINKIFETYSGNTGLVITKL